MEALLSALNPKQREAVLHIDGPVLVLAGAGTGKTRAVTYRIAYLLSKEIDPRNILAVTFTNKAAKEMKKRVIELSPEKGGRVWVSTFHSFCAQVLRIEADKAGISRNYVIYDENDQKSLIKSCMKELDVDEKKYRVGMIYDAIMRAKDNLIDTGSYMIYAGTSDDYLRQLIGSVYKSYQAKLIQNNAFDFGDLLLKLMEVFHNFPEILARYQERFKYVLVDEYQDTNHAQYLLTKYLTGKHRNLFVVGDDDQSIYSWRGADLRNILEFEKEYPDTKVIKLEENYRSTKNILDCAWSVVHNNNMRKEKRLWTSRGAGEDIQIRMFRDEIDESISIADEIDRICGEKDFNLDSFAVFYRTNAQSRVLEEAFLKKNIPYKIYGTVRFYDRMEIKDIISYLRVIVNPDDSVSLKRIINVPHRGIGQTRIQMFENYCREYNVSLWKALSMSENSLLEGKLKIPQKSMDTIKDFIRLLERFRKQAETLSLPEITELIINETGYLKMLEEERTYESKDRIGNIKELVSATNEYYLRNKDELITSPEGQAGKIESFLSAISLAENLSESAENTGESGRVTLMTLHLAKGLEFPVVFVTGMEEGLLPIASAISNESELEEERRLCYVGMTRAKETLYLTYAGERRIYGRIKNNLCSRFIREAQARMATQPHLAGSAETTIRAAAVPAMQQPAGEYRIGQKINHDEFGRGRIVKISGSEEDTKVTVVFEDGSWKKLLLKYANLRTR